MNKIELWRTRRAMSIKDLAAASGINRATINRIEHGKVKPSGKTLGKLAEVLNVDALELFEPDEETETPPPAEQQLKPAV